MTTLTQGIAAQLQGAPVQQMSQQLGIQPEQAQAAIAAALPVLLGALGRNASHPQGAQDLYGAIRNDHSGGLDIGGLLGGILGGQQSRQTNGAGILEHVLGGSQPRAEQAIGRNAGIGQDKANMLLRWLAPIVLAYLAKRMFERREGDAGGGPVLQDAGDRPASQQDRAGPGVLGDILGQETREIERQGGAGSGGILNQVLDRDGDGDVDLGDLMKIGGSVLGGQRGL